MWLCLVARLLTMCVTCSTHIRLTLSSWEGARLGGASGDRQVHLYSQHLHNGSHERQKLWSAGDASIRERCTRRLSGRVIANFGTGFNVLLFPTCTIPFLTISNSLAYMCWWDILQMEQTILLFHIQRTLHINTAEKNVSIRCRIDKINVIAPMVTSISIMQSMNSVCVQFLCRGGIQMSEQF